MAQGAKILGGKHRVTHAHANRLMTLDGVNAFEMLLSELPENLREKLPGLGGQLFAGLATPDGDTWLMRIVMGIDPQQGILVLADVCPPDSELAFFLLDTEAARPTFKKRCSSLKPT